MRVFLVSPTPFEAGGVVHQVGTSSVYKCSTSPCVNLNGNGSQYQRWDFDIGSLDNNAYFNFAQGADPSQWFGKSDTTINSASQGVLYSPFGSWALSLNSWSDPAMRARVAKVLKVVFTFTVVEAQKDRAPCDPCFGPFGMPFLSNPTQWRWAADNETAATCRD